MSNLPLGAKNDPRAPWNEKEPTMQDLDLKVIFIISKNVSITAKEPVDTDELLRIIKDEVKENFRIEEWEIDDIDWENIK